MVRLVDSGKTVGSACLVIFRNKRFLLTSRHGMKVKPGKCIDVSSFTAYGCKLRQVFTVLSLALHDRPTQHPGPVDWTLISPIDSLSRAHTVILLLCTRFSHTCDVAIAMDTFAGISPASQGTTCRCCYCRMTAPSCPTSCGVLSPSCESLLGHRWCKRVPTWQLCRVGLLTHPTRRVRFQRPPGLICSNVHQCERVDLLTRSLGLSACCLPVCHRVTGGTGLMIGLSLTLIGFPSAADTDVKRFEELGLPITATGKVCWLSEAADEALGTYKGRSRHEPLSPAA